MTGFDNPETWQPGEQTKLDHEQLVLRQIAQCRTALNKPAINGYRGNAQLEGTQHAQVSNKLIAERWVHGTNHKANSHVETLYDLLEPYQDEQYKDMEEDLREDAVERLASLLESKHDDKKDKGLLWRDYLQRVWTQRTRPLIRRRFKALLKLCERQGIIGGTPGVEQTS